MTDGMPASLRWRAYELPKSGSRTEESEDALAVDPGTGRFAVADGATETICADVWAKLLVEGYLAHPLVDVSEWHAWLTPLRRQWWDQIVQQTLPWYAEHKLAVGAAAALVGLVIQPDLTWRAIALGDSCLFHIHKGALIKAFPVSRSEDFGNRPPLVGSRPSPVELEPLQANGDLEAGDQILLMTDALAQWFLRENETHHAPSPLLQRVFDLDGQSSEQAAEIDGLRDSQLLRDDDVTLLLIEV